MNAYIYKAALYCEPCGEDLPDYCTSEDANHCTEEVIDSDCQRFGPYPDGGGGKADTPQHCASCGLFLENPLTPDGVEYVREAVTDAPHNAGPHESLVTDEWADFYADALAGNNNAHCANCAKAAR